VKTQPRPQLLVDAETQRVLEANPAAARTYGYRPELVLGWVAAAVLVFSLVAAGRRVAIERGERSSAAFATVVEQQTARTFQAVQLTLAAIGDAHRLASRPAKNDSAFQQMMARRLNDLPFVRALFKGEGGTGLGLWQV